MHKIMPSRSHEEHKDVVQARETGDIKNALCFLKQVSNNLTTTRDMINDRVLFFDINADPGAMSKQKSFANDILRNEFTLGVVDRGGATKTHMYALQALRVGAMPQPPKLL